jgi:hypothetical protein
MLGLFKKKDTMIVARLNDRAMPMDRGSRYEDPLDEALKTKGLGEVTGGGTMLSESKEIQFCDVEIVVKDASEEVLAFIKTTLEGFGAPLGSRPLVGKNKELPFGKTEGLGIYLNGTDLPANVYAECDVNFIYSEFNRLLAPEGSVHSHWEGPTETALYVYGPSVDSMKARLADFLASYPLCERARLERVA